MAEENESAFNRPRLKALSNHPLHKGGNNPRSAHTRIDKTSFTETQQ